MMNYERVQVEEFYGARLFKGNQKTTPKKKCACGGELKTIKEYFDYGMEEKICLKCSEIDFVDLGC